MKVSSSRSAIIAGVLLTVSGIALAWLVIAKSFVAYLAIAAPQQALRLDASEPTVLLERAEAAINADVAEAAAKAAIQSQAPQSERFAFQADAARGMENSTTVHKPLLEPDVSRQLQSALESAVRHDPINPHALRLLGQLAEDARNEQATAKFMEAAVRRSLHESLAVYWLFRRSAAAKDHAATIRYADILLRTRSQFIRFVMPALVAAAETKASVDTLTRLLAANPPWRAQFFEALPASIGDARTPLALFLGLKASSAPARVEEVRGYLEFLLDRKFYDLSYYTWLQLLTPDQLANTGFLFNGSFETGPSKLPFDWVFQGGQGVNIDIVARADQAGHQALLIEFSQGRVEFGGVHQVVMLGPGRYQFKGLTKGQISGRRGLVWRMTCHGSTSGVPLGQSSMMQGIVPPWREFEFTFTVPETECRAQKLSLLLDARSASEQLVTGEIWFDELRIARAVTATR